MDPVKISKLGFTEKTRKIVDKVGAPNRERRENFAGVSIDQERVLDPRKNLVE